MQHELDEERVRRFMQNLGSKVRGPGRVYLTGGASALLFGWRSSTADVDIRFDPEPQGAFEAIRDLKRDLNMNIELASPQDFLPELEGWRIRSVFISREGQVDFFHYDFNAQALSKIARGHDRDVSDVEHMLQLGLIREEELSQFFEEMKPGLIRYPGIDAEAFQARLQAFLERNSLAGR
ncbi:MAG: hypothetical protein CO108_01620 [Deltaproteobacteria bacterium CG_4_9_14_3_um_filter_63_12]|nr:MAG: hypothetical protein CO108_01620 [Deltaproteobacteria bacterium CG_4_9_14_3_um_filter_63_12]